MSVNMSVVVLWTVTLWTAVNMSDVLVIRVVTVCSLIDGYQHLKRNVSSPAFRVELQPPSKRW